MYVRPVVVDLDEQKIVEYKDRFVVPMPKAEGIEYQAANQKPPFGPKLNGAPVVSAEKGFKLDGNTVRLVLKVN